MFEVLLPIEFRIESAVQFDSTSARTRHLMRFLPTKLRLTVSVLMLQVLAMASYSYGEQLLPEDVKNGVVDFVSSGVQQLERVLHGPCPRVVVGFSSLNVSCQERIVNQCFST